MPAVLGRVGVGAGQADRPVGVLGQRGPHLLPDEPPAAVDLAPARVRSEARSEPAPGSLNSWHQISSPRSVGRTNRSRCSSVPCARIVGTAQPAIFRSGSVTPAAASSSSMTSWVTASAPSAVRRGPVRRQVARLRQGPAPLVLGQRRDAGDHSPDLVADGGVAAPEVDLDHPRLPPVARPASEPAKASAGPSRFRRVERTPQVEVRVVLEREADPAEHLDAGLRHPDRAVEGDHPGHVGGEGPLLVVAEGHGRPSQAAAVTDSAVSSISAQRCLTAWKLPIFRPNCSRTPAYSTAVSRHQRATPAASAAARVRAVRRRRPAVSPGTATASASGRSTRDRAEAAGEVQRHVVRGVDPVGGHDEPRLGVAVGRAEQQVGRCRDVPDDLDRAGQGLSRGERRDETDADDRALPQGRGDRLGLAEQRRGHRRTEQGAGHQLLGARLQGDGDVEHRSPAATGGLGQPDRGHAHLADRGPDVVERRRGVLLGGADGGAAPDDRPPTCAGSRRARRGRRRCRSTWVPSGSRSLRWLRRLRSNRLET